MESIVFKRVGTFFPILQVGSKDVVVLVVSEVRITNLTLTDGLLDVQ